MNTLLFFAIVHLLALFINPSYQVIKDSYEDLDQDGKSSILKVIICETIIITMLAIEIKTIYNWIHEPTMWITGLSLIILIACNHVGNLVSFNGSWAQTLCCSYLTRRARILMHFIASLGLTLTIYLNQ